MKQSEAKEFLPIIQAWSEGKTIQYQSSVSHTWFDIVPEEHMGFDRPPSQYRIKPEPKLRPWKPEEVPVGALARPKHQSFVHIIVFVWPNGVRLPDNSKTGGTEVDFNRLLAQFEHSTDGGKTWHPCGVME